MNNETMTKRKSPEIFTDFELLELWKNPNGLMWQITKSKAAQAKYGRGFTIRALTEVAAKNIPEGKNLITEGMMYNLSTRYNAVKAGRIKPDVPLPGGVRERIVQILYLMAVNDRTAIEGVSEFMKSYKKGKYASLMIDAEYFAEDLIDYEPRDIKTSEQIKALVDLMENQDNKLNYLVEQKREEKHYQQMLSILIDELEEIVKESSEEKLKSKMISAISKFRQNLKR